MTNTGKKIAVIGAGNVGATIANDLMIQGLAAEIVLVDIAAEKALGEAMDIYHGVALCEPVRVYSGGYEATAGSDIVIITAGANRKPGQTRLDLAKINVSIFKSILAQVEKYAGDAILVIVSNPVDILTYMANKYSSFPAQRIIGSGTVLDTVRLKSLLAEETGVAAANIHADVLGEHGDTSMVPWSLASINGLSAESQIAEDRRAPLETAMRTAGADVIKRKGATFYGVALSVCRICKAVLRNEKALLPVGSLMAGEYGIDDVCFSVPTVVGGEGIEKRVEVPLSDAELQKLRDSAQALKKFIKDMEI